MEDRAQVTPEMPRARVRKMQDCISGSETDQRNLYQNPASDATEVNYRLQEITDGQVRGFATVPGFFKDRPDHKSTWHYHDCHYQMAVVLKGSAEVAVSADPHVRVTQGSILSIPGGAPHDLKNISADYQVAEITFPGTFGSLPSEKPSAFANIVARAWSQTDAPRHGSARGLITYLYPLAPPLSERYRVESECRSREGFEVCSLGHDLKYKFLIVTAGVRTIEIDNMPSSLEVGDILVIPQGAECRDLGASDDYCGVWLSQIN